MYDIDDIWFFLMTIIRVVKNCIIGVKWVFRDLSILSKNDVITRNYVNKIVQIPR